MSISALLNTFVTCSNSNWVIGTKNVTITIYNNVLLSKRISKFQAAGNLYNNSYQKISTDNPSSSKEKKDTEKIAHKTIAVNGINLHVAEIGEGPPVLLLHGFPELWYTWRHQMLGLSSLGYRAIAPDMRGYGDSDAPPSSSSYTAFHVVGDLVGLLDSLCLDQVFLVGHDWGAWIAWFFCTFRPDRIKALVNLSLAFCPRNPLT